VAEPDGVCSTHKRELRANLEGEPTGKTLPVSQMCCTGGHEPRLENELPRDSLHQLLRTERSVISRCVTT